MIFLKLQLSIFETNNLKIPIDSNDEIKNAHSLGLIYNCGDINNVRYAIKI